MPAPSPDVGCEPEPAPLRALDTDAWEKLERGLPIAAPDPVPVREKRISVSVAAALMSVSLTASVESPPKLDRVRVLLTEFARFRDFAFAFVAGFLLFADDFSLPLLAVAAVPASLLFRELLFFGECGADWEGGSGAGTGGASGLWIVRARLAGGGARIEAKRLWVALLGPGMA